MRTYVLLIFLNLLFLCILCAGISDVFLTWANLLNILTASSTIGLLAIGAAFVLGSGGLDLSVGSLMGLSATVSAIAAVDSSFVLLRAVVACLLTGILCGALNGLLIGRGKLPAFIVTLGMLSLARGGALVFSGGRPAYDLPDSVVFLGQGRLGSVPVPVVVFAIASICCFLLINHTRFGRHCLAMGDNESAARNAGILIVRRKIELYAFSGFLAAVAALLAMGRVNSADPNLGSGYELTAITAAIIGGTSLTGGRTSVIGAILGALTMGVLQNGLTLLDVPAYYQQVAVGVVLMLAVVVGQWKGLHALAN